MLEIYAGLMSGTSIDGVDGVLLDFSDKRPCVIQAASLEMPDALRSELLALNQSGEDELHRAALAANELARLYSAVMDQLLTQSGRKASEILAIGAHGQTVRHQPASGYTLQLNNPALLAELTGINVIADFRSRCVAAGGQGAPLAPFFHAAMFSRPNECVTILNLGGISNLTVLPPAGQVHGQLLGFDCGPGNALMDYWCQTHLGDAYDDAGTWAASGRVHDDLLSTLLADSYFNLRPPKSTGRDLFNPTWLYAHLGKVSGPSVSTADVQATLCALTARSCASAVKDFAPDSTELLVCGGGAFNLHLIKLLQRHLPGCVVRTTSDRGIPPMQVEAAAFAWLARQMTRREAIPLKSTTGAKGSRILGCLYPA
ncbi:MAG: anhydro-N-acetylmuramic acid kinase [Hylemonella sp.]|nr:anhydro-N-acetylmuramic acid kinase [Hylemonella sp.]